MAEKSHKCLYIAKFTTSIISTFVLFAGFPFY